MNRFRRLPRSSITATIDATTAERRRSSRSIADVVMNALTPMVNAPSQWRIQAARG